MIRSRISAAMLLLLFVPASGAAQPGVEEIRQLYQRVKEDIDMGTGPYVTELAVNAEGLMYPAVGIFQEWVTFHWESRGGYSWPVLVVWRSEHSAISEYGELLQASGKTFLPDGGVVEFVPEGPASYTYNRTPEQLTELFEAIH